MATIQFPSVLINFNSRFLILFGCISFHFDGFSWCLGRMWYEASLLRHSRNLHISVHHCPAILERSNSIFQSTSQNGTFKQSPTWIMQGFWFRDSHFVGKWVCLTKWPPLEQCTAAAPQCLYYAHAPRAASYRIAVVSKGSLRTDTGTLTIQFDSAYSELLETIMLTSVTAGCVHFFGSKSFASHHLRPILSANQMHRGFSVASTLR